MTSTKGISLKARNMVADSLDTAMEKSTKADTITMSDKIRTAASILLEAQLIEVASRATFSTVGASSKELTAIITKGISQRAKRTEGVS